MGLVSSDHRHQQQSAAIQTSLAILSMTSPNLSLSWLFSPSILISRAWAIERKKRKPSCPSLKHMASPNSEIFQGLIRPQNPGRYHCHQCRTTTQGSHPVSIPSYLFPGSRLSQACSSIQYVSISRSKILGIHPPVKHPEKAKLDASLYFSRVTPSFSSALLRLVCAQNNIVPHWTMHGISMSYCRASRIFASCNETL